MLFQINESRSEYLRKLEIALQKLHNKYKTDKEEKDKDGKSGSGEEVAGGGKVDDQEGTLIPECVKFLS
jgi:hypothetical protein